MNIISTKKMATSSNRKVLRILGITGSLILVLNYLVIVTFFNNVNPVIIDVLFVAGFLAFYIALCNHIKMYSLKSETVLLRALIIIELLAFVFQMVNGFFFALPDFIFTLLYILIVIVFVIFGIKVLKYEDINRRGIGLLKRFIVSMFFAYLIIGTGSIMLLITHQMQFVQWLFTIYAIPYIFGFMYFLKQR